MILASNRNGKRALVIDFYKFVAIPECRTANTLHAASDGYACKTVAISKCTIAYTRYAVRNDDACKIFATIERIASDARHAVRNDDACKTCAISERILPDDRHTFRDSNTLQRGAAIKCTFSNLILFNQRATACRERCGKRECRLRTMIADKIALAAVVEEAIAV